MSILSKAYFHDEEAAFEYLESIVWPEGPYCPHCGSLDRIGKIKANPEKRVRYGLHKCGECKVSDMERTDAALLGIKGKRLTYRGPDYNRTESN